MYAKVYIQVLTHKSNFTHQILFHSDFEQTLGTSFNFSWHTSSHPYTLLGIIPCNFILVASVLGLVC